MTLTDEDVGRMREEHKPHKCDMDCKGWCLLKGTCPKCLAPHPCDAYRLLEEREALKAELGRAFKGFSDIAAEIIRLDPEHESRIMQGDEAVTVAAWAVEWMRDKMARISELESAPKAGPSSIPLGSGFEERRAQEIAAIRRSEKLPDMSQRVGTPKAEAPMTRDTALQMAAEFLNKNTGMLNRYPLSELFLSIAAAARREADEQIGRALRMAYERTPDCQTIEEAVGSLCDFITKLEQSRDKAEHSRQALAEALRDLINEEGDEPMVEHEHFIAPGIRCPRCLIVKALAAHGQDEKGSERDENGFLRP